MNTEAFKFWHSSLFLQAFLAINFKQMKKILFPAAVCFMALATNSFAQKKGPDKILGNKIYEVELIAQGGKKASEPEKDEISFKGGKLVTKMLQTDFEFEAAPYTVTVDSTNMVEGKPTISFEAESKNTADEPMKWTGTVTGETIEGTVVWTGKKGKVKKEYIFTGTQKGKKKKPAPTK